MFITFPYIEMENIIFNNSIINSAEELVPFVSIAALDRKNFCPKLLDATPKADKYLLERFGEKYVICSKAREAILVVLNELSLHSTDVVTILTTTGNSYISGCVTRAIEKVCQWSREFTPDTKAIFVNHEFGYAYENLKALKSYNLPIIEDCAHSYFTESEDIGMVGDFVIYSLPKAFSTQLGSVLVYRDSIAYKTSTELDKYVRSALEPQVLHVEEFKAKRLANYNYYLEKLSPLGVSPYFKLKDGDIPGVFMFKFEQPIDYRLLKSFLNSNGIDSSVYFGQDAYFIPVHHNVSQCELDYIINLIFYFIEHEVQ